MIICSDKETERQRGELYSSVDSLPFTDWERKFIESVGEQTFPLTLKQKETISKLYFRHFDE